MGIIAVAGGTGDFGRTIVDQLVGTGKHKVLILSRRDTSPPISGTELLVIDYNNVEKTTESLNEKAVDTIISTLGPGSAEAQLNLIAAAEAASSTKRFIPSEFGSYGSSDDTDEFHADVRRAADTLRKTGLQFTRFAIGLFMDYFGAPNIPTHLRSFVWGIDARNRQAAIPGSGNDIMTATYSKDVARYVERLLDDDVWSEWSIVSGSDFTMNQLLALVEKYTGEKFNVTYDSEEKLARGEATVLSSDAGYGGADPKAICAYFGMGLIQGKVEVPKEGRLNDRYPEIKPLSIEQLLSQAWGAK